MAAKKPDYSRVLGLSDLHYPYHHKDSFDFIDKVYDYYKPTYNFSVGDEGDYHDASYHDSDTGLWSADEEMEHTIKNIQKLESIIEQLDLARSNHGTMPYRKAKTAKLPRQVIKTEREMYEVGEGWQWHDRIIVPLPNKQKLIVRHQKVKNSKVAAQSEGMNYCQGHYHGTLDLQYYANEWGMYWGATIGCLIDDESLAFAYNKTDKERPCLGLIMILEGEPVLIPMRLDSKRRWTKKFLKL